MLPRPLRSLSWTPSSPCPNRATSRCAATRRAAPERDRLRARLAELAGERLDLTMTIDGQQRMGGGDRDRRRPAAQARARARGHPQRDQRGCRGGGDGRQEAAPGRGVLCPTKSGPRSSCARPTCSPVRGATRSTPPPCSASPRPCIQAEIDAACELIDFLRFNVHFGHKLLGEQPLSSPGVWNRFDHRPLEGFVYAITPFNFTAIAGNLPAAPALMGNTVVWKPSPTQQFAAHFTMRLFEAAGLPPGVINMVTGDGLAVSEVALADPDLAGIHFTGSTGVFQHLWQTVGAATSTATGRTRGWSARPAARTSSSRTPAPTPTRCTPR